jgi:hypothetical protein
MNNFYLTSEAKAILELRHKQCLDVKKLDRIKAILLRSEDWTIPMIAQALATRQDYTEILNILAAKKDLIMAAYIGSAKYEVVKFFLDNNVNVNKQNKDGKQP